MEKLINKKNQLLVKDDVGKAKPATRDLPPDGFTFGRADKKDQENAGIITSSWKMHEQSKPKGSERDFRKLNKMSIKEGIVDSKNQKDFRMQNDPRIEHYIDNKCKKFVVPETSAFGRPNRPSTPINGVINNYYGEAAKIQIDEKYGQSFELKKHVKGMPEPKETSGHLKAVEFIKMKATVSAEDKPQFKLKRFQNVDARINTNRVAAKAANL